LLKKTGHPDGFTIEWEPAADKALDRVRRGDVDLVLLDYQMPVITGLDLLPQIRQVDLALPVIMLTGQGNESVAVQAIKRGAHDYLRKDQLDPAALLATILTALDRHRLERELAANREAQERDLLLARELQQAFLPDNFPHFAPQQTPDAMGLRFYHRYTPTLAVGGDFFDVVPIDHQTAGVFLADVEGHGLPAALVTAVLRTLIEEHKETAADGPRFLQQINDGLHRILSQTTTPVFASAFYLAINTADHRLAFCSAQHPPQLHVCRRAEEILTLHDPSKAGPILGSVDQAAFPAHLGDVADDDLFVLFSSGILELPDPDGDPFGLARLKAAIGEGLTDTPAAIVDRIVRAATAHAESPILPEDLCLVAIEAGTIAQA
jgi:sigma-B regulation protein RsbU (phosphoserine phosphatase)